MPDPVFAAQIAHGHDLDKGQVHIAFCAPADDAEKLILVEALQGNHIDLDPQTCGLGGINTADHLGQAAPACDAGKLVIVKCIQ